MAWLWRAVRSPIFLECMAAVLATVIAYQRGRQRTAR